MIARHSCPISLTEATIFSMRTTRTKITSSRIRIRKSQTLSGPVLDLHEAAASLGDGGGVIEALGCPAAAIHGRIAPRLGSLFIARFSCVLSGPRDLFYRAGFLSLWYDSMAFIIL